MQRAQRNLCCKLGLLNDEPQPTPIEAALQEFHATFNGPPAVEATAALNEMFNLDDGKADAMINALIGMVGEGIDDLQEAVENAAI